MHFHHRNLPLPKHKFQTYISLYRISLLVLYIYWPLSCACTVQMYLKKSEKIFLQTQIVTSHFQYIVWRSTPLFWKITKSMEYCQTNRIYLMVRRGGVVTGEGMGYGWTNVALVRGRSKIGSPPPPPLYRPPPCSSSFSNCLFTKLSPSEKFLKMHTQVHQKWRVEVGGCSQKNKWHFSVVSIYHNFKV